MKEYRTNYINKKQVDTEHDIYLQKHSPRSGGRRPPSMIANNK
jgi:hypothetical protein